MTEHQLKLKATLDTQEVQNELNKLRTQQQQALGGGQNGIESSNLNALNSTISKLNATIAQLQKAITGIAKGVKAPATAVQAALGPSKSQFIPPIALPTPKAGKQTAARLGSYVQKTIDEQVKKAVLDAAQHNPSSLYKQMSGGPFGIFGGTKGSAAEQKTFKRIFDGMRASDIVNNGQLTPQAQAYFKNYLPAQPTWLNKNLPSFFPTESKRPGRQMMQGVRLMAGSYMLGGLSHLGQGQSWEEAPFTKGVGAVAGAASGGMMAGGAAAMMGLGPVGIAAAAALPVVDELSKAIGELASEKILKVASALQRASDAWEQMYENFQQWDFGKFKEKVAGLDFGNLEGERAAARSQYDTDKKDYDEFMSGWVTRMRSLDKQYFSGQITAGQYANAKQDANTELESYKEAMEKAKDKLDAVNAVYEAHKKALEDFNNVVKQAAQFDKRLNEFDAEQTAKDVLKTEDPEKIRALMPTVQADIDKATAAMAPIRDAGGLAEYEKKTNTYREKLLTAEPGSKEADSLRAIIKAREEAAEAYKQSAADLMKAVAKSKSLEDAIDQLQKQLQEYARNASSQKNSLAQDQEAAKNTLTQKWGRVGNDVLDKSSKEYWTKAGSYRKAYEEALTKMQTAKTPEEAKAAQEEANEAKSNWQFNERQAISFDQSIVSRLQEKLANLKAPDNTQVNSLASQGLMINKSDDEIRWKMQTDYASQQTQIQRDIRDRLNQMDTSATYQ